MTETIDRWQRPSTYFRPQALKDFLQAQVKNEAVRARVETLLEVGEREEAEHLLREVGLNRTALRKFEQLHPAMMGGNYLPDRKTGEVEIARIAIESTTADVTCVYARMESGQIHYRVVDEYNGETLGETTETTSERPLTLRELVDFFLGAWSLEDVVESNFEQDLEGKLEFFCASSSFYPQLHRACQERVTQHHLGLYDEAENDESES